MSRSKPRFDSRARALLELGSLQVSRVELERAVDLAEAVRHEHLAIEIWMVLAGKIAVQTTDADAGHRAMRRLRAKVAASGRERELGGDLALVEGHLALTRAEPDQAEAPLRDAILRFEQLGRRADLAQARWVLARTLEQLGRPAEALEQYRRVVLEVEQIHGPGHPKVAERRRDLGIALLEQGEIDEGRAELNHALAIWAEAPEMSQIDLLDGYLIAAMFDLADGRLEQARAHARRAEAIARARADDHPLALAQVDAMLAAIDYGDGEFERAMQEFERAARRFEAGQGSTDPTAIQTWTGCGWAALLAGQPTRAEQAFARVPLAHVAHDSNQAISVRLGLAMTKLLRGEPDAARDEIAELPAELEPFFALERELIRVFSDDPSEAAIARLHESGQALDPADRREFAALLTLSTTHVKAR